MSAQPWMGKTAYTVYHEQQERLVEASIQARCAALIEARKAVETCIFQAGALRRLDELIREAQAL